MAIVAYPTTLDCPTELLDTLLDGSPTGILRLRPVYAADGELVDWAYVRLNPAAQQLLQLPEYPAACLRRYTAEEKGHFTFCQLTFESGKGGFCTVQHPLAGCLRSFRVAAQRNGPELVVSVTAIEVSSGAADVTSRLPDARWGTLETGSQHQLLQHVFEQAPVAMAVLRGPRYIVELANPAVCALWGRTLAETLHQPVFELLPEAAGQGFEQLLDGVLATGVAHVAVELPSFIDRHGRRDTVYWTLVYHPMREANGRITGVLVVATEVSEQVLARQGLAAYQQLQAVFEQAPVAVSVFTGPEYRIAVCNPGMQAIWGRTAAQVLHQPLFDVLPEIMAQSFAARLGGVYNQSQVKAAMRQQVA